VKIKNVPKELAVANGFKQIGDNIYDIPAVWFEHDEDNNAFTIKLIDQRYLPHKFEVFEAKNYEDTANAIREMVIRGAPAIGAMAAYGMAQAALQNADLELVSQTLKATRPTAFDLFFAVDYMNSALSAGKDVIETTENYVNQIIDRCKKIGEFGNTLISTSSKLLTHCNAGALATVDYGTALAPMRAAHDSGKEIFVFVDETRPRLQGANLTAWELYNEDIAHTLIADNAAGFYLKRGEVDLVIVGADRIAKNGDAANKIGTYEKAVLAKENGVPFYVAAPASTFDPGILTGAEIPIEERNSQEVLLINGTKITADGVMARNPAFDVTPNKFITGFITEYGILPPNKIEEVLTKSRSNTDGFEN
jgi:translation initiation factor eIF-2B subunit alpha/methylthioribose-1-phosphate isomerase